MRPSVALAERHRPRFGQVWSHPQWTILKVLEGHEGKVLSCDVAPGMTAMLSSRPNDPQGHAVLTISVASCRVGPVVGWVNGWPGIPCACWR
jgi:hypothetical protein